MMLPQKVVKLSKHYPQVNLTALFEKAINELCKNVYVKGIVGIQS